MADDGGVFNGVTCNLLYPVCRTLSPPTTAEEQHCVHEIIVDGAKLIDFLPRVCNPFYGIDDYADLAKESSSEIAQVPP